MPPTTAAATGGGVLIGDATTAQATVAPVATLPRTGSAAGPEVAAALVLAACGAALLGLKRRFVS